jgi:hypothetical protein
MQDENAASQTPDAWSDWDAENMGFHCEPGVGLTVDDDLKGASDDASRWLSWEEVLRMHAWLGRKIEDAIL